MPETIEAVVLEIDGGPPTSTPCEAEPEPVWKSFHSKIVRLDRRWWPLWVVAGIVAAGLVLTLGVVIAAMVVVARLCGGILRFMTAGISRRERSDLSRPFF